MSFFLTPFTQISARFALSPVGVDVSVSRCLISSSELHLRSGLDTRPLIVRRAANVADQVPSVHLCICGEVCFTLKRPPRVMLSASTSLAFQLPDVSIENCEMQHHSEEE